MDRAELTRLLELDDFSPIYRRADEVRRREVGDEVKIRAILEFSNHCRRRCAYCGLNAGNPKLPRYRMTPEEMVDVARQARAAGYLTLVLQSGEDAWYTAEILGEIIREIKKLDMAVTVSCGEKSAEEYAYLKKCGADRYLLKHETSDPALYAKLHPCGTLANRIQCLKDIKRLKYETGSGFMIGLPGQTTDTIARDILLLKELKCDMAGIGPFIPHPDTPLNGAAEGSTELTKRAVALARLVLPKANLPATTSLGVIDDREKDDVFSCGANVIMTKVTPEAYKAFYEIYPSRVTQISIEQGRKLLEEQIRKLGKIPV